MTKTKSHKINFVTQKSMYNLQGSQLPSNDWQRIHIDRKRQPSASTALSYKITYYLLYHIINKFLVSVCPIRLFYYQTIDVCEMTLKDFSLKKPIFSLIESQN